MIQSIPSSIKHTRDYFINKSEKKKVSSEQKRTIKNSTIMHKGKLSDKETIHIGHLCTKQP
jgi:hypothetical protein